MKRFFLTFSASLIISLSLFVSLALSSESSQSCFDVKASLSSLPMNLAPWFRGVNDIRTLLSGDGGFTYFTAKQLHELEQILQGQGSRIVRRANQAQVAKLEPHLQTSDVTAYMSFDRLTTRGPIAIRGRFSQELRPFDPEVDAQYRSGLSTLHEIYNMPIPNLEEIVGYWLSRPSGTPRLTKITMISHLKNNKVARIIGLPRLFSLPKQARDLGILLSDETKFGLPELEFDEQAITPQTYSRLRVVTENSYFPIQYRPLNEAPGQPLVPDYFNFNEIPTRKFFYTKAKLRPYVVTPMGPRRSNASAVVASVPKAKWVMSVAQPFEDPDITRLRSAIHNTAVHNTEGNQIQPEPVFSERSRSFYQTPSQEQTVYRLTYYAQEGAPRELFDVFFYRDQPLEESPMYHPGLSKVFDELLDTPDEVIYAHHKIRAFNFSSWIAISGKFPVSEHEELFFIMRLNLDKQEFLIDETQVRPIENQRIYFFQHQDFNPSTSKWFEIIFATLYPGAIAHSLHGDIVLQHQALKVQSELGTHSDGDTPTISTGGSLALSEGEKGRMIKGYLTRHIPFFRGFEQKYR